jgi:hypothetical protein
VKCEKTKKVAFCGPEPIRSKTVTDNKIIEVNVFNYLGCSLSYEGEKDIDVKISKFLQIAGLINTIFKPSNSVAQEPEGSSPHSQQPATGPCPEPVESNPHPPSQSP